jgi:hypothetical protein
VSPDEAAGLAALRASLARGLTIVDVTETGEAEFLSGAPDPPLRIEPLPAIMPLSEGSL